MVGIGAVLFSLLAWLELRCPEAKEVPVPKPEVSEQTRYREIAERLVGLIGCAADSLPEKIVIGCGTITVWMGGKDREYSLTEEGTLCLPKIRTVFYPDAAVGTEEGCYVENPQIALAVEMNCMLGGGYRICDCAERKVWAEDGRLCGEYVSKHIELILR